MLNGPAEPLILRARGHPNIRATHDKTVELTAERDITPRATCVVGTVAAAQLASLTGLRGSVTVTLRVGELEDRITGVANPRFAGGSRAVIRRSDYRSPETLVTQADKSAAELDRDLVRALADPAAQIDVIIELGAGAPQRTAELLVCPWQIAAALAHDAHPPTSGPSPAGGWAAALRSALLLVGVGPGVEPARGLADQTGQAMTTDLAALRPRLERGDAVALICDVTPAHDLVAALVGDVAREGWMIRAVGTPATTAALVAAGLIGAPFADLGRPPTGAARRRRQIAALARASVVGVWSARVTTLSDLLAQIADGWADAPAAVSVGIGDPDEIHIRDRLAAVADASTQLPHHRNAVAVVDLRDPAASGVPDIAARDLLAALLEAGVAATTLSRALRRLPGITRREAYEIVHALRPERSAQQ